MLSGGTTHDWCRPWPVCHAHRECVPLRAPPLPTAPTAAAPPSVGRGASHSGCCRCWGEWSSPQGRGFPVCFSLWSRTVPVMRSTARTIPIETLPRVNPNSLSRESSGISSSRTEVTRLAVLAVTQPDEIITTKRIKNPVAILRLKAGILRWLVFMCVISTTYPHLQSIRRDPGSHQIAHQASR